MEKVISYRREFHMYPENGWREIRTSARIAELLESFGYKDILLGNDVLEEHVITLPIRLTQSEKLEEMDRAVMQGAKELYVNKTNGLPGVIAQYDTGIDGPVTAFRFDMDALPYDELDSMEHRPKREGFSSLNKESVHACGHDGHVAIGLDLADKIINGNFVKTGKVKFIFQPAEETFSGAESIVAKGHLDDVKHFVALHINLDFDGKPLPSNTIGCGCKNFLSDRQLDVYYKGKSAHPCGASQEGKNALLAACTASINLHAIAPHDSGLFRVNVGELHAGVCANTIAPNALLRVEYRGEKPEITTYGKEKVERIIKSAAEMYDLEYDIIDYGEVPTTQSDDEMMELIQKAASEVKWFEKVYFECSAGGSDDAAVMMNKVKSNGGIASYVGIGADSTDVLHNKGYDFDENCLIASVEMCLNLLRNIHK